MWMSHISQSMVGIGLLASTIIHGVLGANGGSYCADVMCVGATISGGNTFYTLNTTVPFSKLGWMAIGFGTEMAGSPMMILWPNSDGSVTLSQRSAGGENEPKVVSNPPRKATLQTGLSTLTGSAVTLSFSVPNSGQSSEEIIYGLSLHRPSSDVGAILQVHNFKGDFKLDLTQTVADLPSSVTAGTGSSSNTLPLPTGNESNQAYWPPLSSWEKMMVTHGVVSALGFCLFLPIGVLQARFLRIWWPKWFKAHWIIQFVLAGLTIVAGVGLGVAAVHQSGGSHFSDKHMIIGLVLFLLYIGQALYGYVIHKVKKANRTRRPIQNYGHAIVGLGLIALALYQVWLGFDDEWSDITGRDKPSHGLYTFWTVWTAVLGGAYILGLALLPKQYSGEAQAVRDREKSQGMSGSYDDMYPLAERAS